MPTDARILPVNAEIGTVSSRVSRPDQPWAMMVLAHGAGAGMRHRFLEILTGALNRHGLAVYRFQFPYMERGSRRPDRPPVLTATIRAAISTAAEEAAGLPLVAGGKSMGGRMTSLAASEAPLPGVRGVFFVGFPLHAPRKPDVRRADHLRSVNLPLLFIQGTRDPMAPLETLSPIVRDLGPQATMHVMEGADHSFAIRKRDRPDSTGPVHEELASIVATWVATVCRTGSSAQQGDRDRLDLSKRTISREVQSRQR